MQNKVSRPRGYLFILTGSFLSLFIVLFFVFEAYTIIEQQEANGPLPPFFGNFERVRKVLSDAPRKETFEFAVFGDTGSTGTFERIVEKLRETPVDFAVLLGDAFKWKNQDKYFLAESKDEFLLPFPVLYIMGNNELKFMSVSRFEELFGPTLFSFEYQDCLFIVLRMIDEPQSNQESINFLKSFLPEKTAEYRKIFVFMHIPPPIPTFDTQMFYAPGELIPLFDKQKVNYVLSGHYHGYTRTKFSNTNYIVSGGGGSSLKNKIIQQFFHAVIIRVGKDYEEERIIHVPESIDIEDLIERFAIVTMYPWLKQNRVLVGIINTALLVVLIWFCGCFYRHIR